MAHSFCLNDSLEDAGTLKISYQNHQFPKTTRHLPVLDSNSFFHQTLPEFSNDLDHVR